MSESKTSTLGAILYDDFELREGRHEAGAGVLTHS
jgi:hypothetical protein